MTYLALSVKIMFTLIISTYSLVFIGNLVWNYDAKRMPWAFKGPLALSAIAMFASIFNAVIAAIWSLP